MNMDKKIAKWMYLGAVLQFAAAVFQITADRYISGTLFFGAAVCFVSAAAMYEKKAREKSGEDSSHVEN